MTFPVYLAGATATYALQHWDDSVDGWSRLLLAVLWPGTVVLYALIALYVILTHK